MWISLAFSLTSHHKSLPLQPHHPTWSQTRLLPTCHLQALGPALAFSPLMPPRPLQMPSHHNASTEHPSQKKLGCSFLNFIRIVTGLPYPLPMGCDACCASPMESHLFGFLSIQHTVPAWINKVVQLYPRGTCFKFPTGCLKPQMIKMFLLTRSAALPHCTSWASLLFHLGSLLSTVVQTRAVERHDSWLDNQGSY